MEYKVLALVKKVNGPMESTQVPVNEFLDFGVKEAEEYLKITDVRQTTLKRQPGYQIDMFSAQEGKLAISRVNEEDIYGDLVIVRRKDAQGEYTTFIAEDMTDDDIETAKHALNIESEYPTK